MSEEYTVPALRDTANDLRAKAAQHYAAEEIKARQIMEAAKRDADAMVAAAVEIDAIANGQMVAAPELPSTLYASCLKCGNPIMKDELGWAHPPGNAGLCIDPTAPTGVVPAEQPMADDTLVASGQSATTTAVDGQGVTGEVAQ